MIVRGTAITGFAPNNARQGGDITVTEWQNPAWWQDTTPNGPEFDPAVWDFSGLGSGLLPRLLNMPGGLAAQNPMVIP